MTPQIKKIVRRLYTKLILNIKYSKTNKLNETEKILLSICRNMISHENSNFLVDPLSAKRYIKNDDLGLFIILDGGTISITNHEYHYDVKLSDREWDRLIFFFDNKTEKIRQNYEEEIIKQINLSLNNIKKKIKNSQINSKNNSN